MSARRAAVTAVTGMNKIKRQFVGQATAAIFVLLTVLLSVINMIDFTLASQDADRVTQMLAEDRGIFGADRFRPGPMNDGEKRGPMGPDSPEMPDSLRYFTFAFGADGSAQTVAFRMTALTEEEAQQWAQSLLRETTGWTRLTYRYRAYEKDGLTYVTVIDQGRELLSAYRILIISAVGEVVFLLISLGVLIVISGRLLDPIDRADRRQKGFIAEVEHNFKVPLTVLNAGTELLEKEHGATEITRSMRGQLRRLSALVGDLGRFALLGEENNEQTETDLSALLRAQYEKHAGKLQALSYRIDAAPDVRLAADETSLAGALGELFDNQAKFALGQASCRLLTEGKRILLTFENDTALPDGSYDQAFDRFTRLPNAEGIDGAGLGLARVREVVKAHNGRIEAFVRDGSFTVRVSL